MISFTLGSKKSRMAIISNFLSVNALCIFLSAKHINSVSLTQTLKVFCKKKKELEKEREKEIADHLWFHDAYHSMKLLWFAVKMIRPAC